MQDTSSRVHSVVLNEEDYQAYSVYLSLPPIVKRAMRFFCYMTPSRQWFITRMIYSAIPDEPFLPASPPELVEPPHRQVPTLHLVPLPRSTSHQLTLDPQVD